MNNPSRKKVKFVLASLKIPSDGARVRSRRKRPGKRVSLQTLTRSVVASSNVCSPPLTYRAGFLFPREPWSVEAPRKTTEAVFWRLIRAGG